ncbi:hypothetical protein GCM10011289_12410 [Paludibacterium paludis]|uniref:Flagellar protein n=1 Tax=Paludibacterium paludis TaxID=1225769 RepID=A0A918P0B7_9NEIS|nr:hypothetical protein GCM10011289_12410 [Paludibacterium paludis]
MLALAPGFAVAAQSAAAVAPSPVASLAQVLFGLVLVLALILGAAALFRRFSGAMGGGLPGRIKLVSALMVGQKERVVIVEVGEEWLVLGVTAHAINLLSRMPRSETPPGEVLLPTDPFARWLKAAIDKTRKRPDSPTS